MSNNVGTLSPLVNVPSGGLHQVYQSNDINRFDVSLSGTSSDLTFNRYQDSLGQTQTRVMTISRTTGNVGIGTSNPSSKLHLYGFASGNAIRLQGDPNGHKIDIFNNSGSTGNFGLQIARRNDTDNGWVRFYELGNSENSVPHAWYDLTGTERMRMNSVGNLGIGSNNPQEKLQVNGNVIVGSNAANSYNNIKMGGGNSFGYIFGSFPGVADGINISYNHYYDETGVIRYVNTGTGAFNSAIQVSYGEIKLKTGLQNTVPETRMVVDRVGNVGIGIANPATRLDISSNMRIRSSRLNTDPRPPISVSPVEGEIRGGDGSIGSNHGFLRLSAGGGSNSTSQAGIDISGFSVNTDMNNNIVMYTTDNERMRITSTGNVGIGASSPSARLHITNSQGGQAGNLLFDANVSSGYSAKFELTDDGVEFSSFSTIRGFKWLNGPSPIERMRLTPAGNLGIGNSSPSTQLVVQQISDGNVGGNGITLRGLNGKEFGMCYLSTSGLNIVEDRSATRVTMLPGGNVGIGQTNPQSRLRVDGNPSTSTEKTVVRVQGAATSGDSIQQGQSLLTLVDQSTGTGNMKGIGFARTVNANMVAGIQHSVLGGGDGNLDFYTSAAGQDDILSLTMRLGGNGNVGIGTTNPESKLDVREGNIRIGANPGGEGNGFAPGTVRFGVEYYNNDLGSANTPGVMGAIRPYVHDNTGYSGLGIWNNTAQNTPVNFSTQTPQMLFRGGNVGIGITNPSQKLTVNGNISVTGNITPSANILYDIGSSTLRFRDIFLSGNSVHLGSAVISVGTGGQVEFRDETTNELLNISALNTGNISSDSGNTIFTDGNVGIGITDPADKLHVLGAIRFGDSALAANQARIFSGSTFSGWQTQAGVNAITILQTNGNVGIGTTNPGTSKLFVSGTLGTSSNLVFTSGSSTIVVGPAGTSLAPRRNFLNIESQINTERILRIRRGGDNPTHAGLMISNFDANNYLFRTTEGGSLRLDYLNASQYELQGNFGTNLLSITNTGDVGIGTTTPAKSLHVLSGSNPLRLETSNAGCFVEFFNNSPTERLAFIGPNSAASKQFQFVNESDNDGSFLFRTRTGGTFGNRMIILNNGNVGIGTTNPSSNRLRVNISTTTNVDTIAAMNDNIGGRAIVSAIDPTTNRFANLGMNNTNSLTDSSYGLPGEAFLRSSTNALGLLLSTTAAVPIRFVTNSSERMKITSAGNVGIGNSNPFAKLHVGGGLRVQGNDPNFLLGGIISGFIDRDPDATIRIGSLTGGVTPTGAQGDVSFTVNNFERMRIKANGNVGIGTSDPGTSRLFVSGTLDVRGNISVPFTVLSSGTSQNTEGIIINDQQTYTRIVSSYYDTVTTRDVLDLQPAGSSGSNIILRSGLGANGDRPERMRINTAGNVGIGTPFPLYPLHVSRSISTTFGPGYEFSNLIGPDQYGSYTNNFSIYSQTGVAGQIFYAFSDERIKKNIIDIDDESALNTLRQIKPKQYSYIDKRTRTDRNVLGFIAQEVKEVLPHAVSLMTDVVPDIICYGDAADGVITLSKIHNLSVDTRVKIIQESGKEGIFKVTELIDEYSFKVNTDELSQKVFIYGREVDDFHALDKNTIFTVNCAATQELDRQVQSLKQKNSVLEAHIVSLEERLARLEAMI